MIAYFCQATGCRIVGPGVCKAVDPVNGVDLYVEPVDSNKPKDTKPAESKSDEKGKSDDKPSKGKKE
jgi:hypothetical protein